MISNLSDNFNSVASRLESRMSEIEGNVEKRLTVKFDKVIHDKVKSEVGKLKDQISSEVNELKEKVVSLGKSKLRHLADGLKLADINVAKLVRKTSRSDDRPGIVVITFATMEHKKGVLKAKRVLKNSTKYSRVYIENDLPLQQRINNNNNRTLLKALGRDNDFMIKYVRKKSDDICAQVNGQRANNYPRSRTDRNRHNQ
ncbi:unnamed protein product [Mytilus edulis]|uniref:Uncharacterized protein n=1 Tax=Mytilus edulis TaxID=6550 RepID=A0A8S3QEG2_MYTED|nr:unnamed protein product [Mytilus edulis]